MTPVRFSNLKHMALSPAHYRHATDTPFVASKAMRLGTLTHRLLLGGPIVMFDGASRRGKAWDAFVSGHDPENVFLPSERAVADAMTSSVRRSEMAMSWLDGAHEKRIDWTFAGRACRSTPDVANRDRRFVCDVKTARTAEPGRFVREALSRAYHAQLGFYGEALGLGVDDAHVIVAVESSPPYPVTVLQLTPRAVEAGRKLCRLWMERVIACEAAGEWPGYSQSIVDMDVPDELDLDFGGTEEEEDES